MCMDSLKNLNTYEAGINKEVDLIHAKTRDHRCKFNYSSDLDYKKNHKIQFIYIW